jgi:hypothetical protein
MAKHRKKQSQKAYEDETPLATPEEVNEITSKVTGQPIETGTALFSPEDLLPKKKKKTGQNEYISNTGRKRINTLMHPDLKNKLLIFADNHNMTLPDAIEHIICKALGIEEPSKKK